jgi:hypothetical protein
MAEYNLAFGKKLAETAGLVIDAGIDSQEAERAVAYLSLLSTEVSLKSMLEKAGFAPRMIRKHSHNLPALLKELCKCEIEFEFSPGCRKFVSAARLCPMSISYKNTRTPVGRVIGGELEGASRYPNEVRYGSTFHHFPPEVLFGMADAVSSFAFKNWTSIRYQG